MNEYVRYTPLGCAESKRTKDIEDERVINATPRWYIDSRKSNTTKEEQDKLCEGLSFEIVGDPEGCFEFNTKYFLCRCKICGRQRNVAINYLKNKSAVCNGCFVLRLRREASLIGLTLIGDSTDGKRNRRNYKFEACGHTRNISTGDVRSGDVSCTECYQLKLDNLFNKYGLISMGRPSEDEGLRDYSQWFKVKYKSCGHERLLLQNHLVSDSVGRCEVCYEQSLQAEYGDLLGFKILSKEPGARRKIRFDKCGHEKIVGLSNMKSNSINCQICDEERWKTEAVESGLKWVSTGKETQTGKYHQYLADCGHTLFIKPNHVRLGHWSCRECNSGYLDRLNYIYIFKISNKDNSVFLKLGYSMKPEYRKNDYFLSDGTSAEMLKKIQIPTGRQAMLLENAIHAKYKTHNLPKDFTKQYLTESGYTECYPMFLEKELIGELERIEREISIE